MRGYAVCAYVRIRRVSTMVVPDRAGLPMVGYHHIGAGRMSLCKLIQPAAV